MTGSANCGRQIHMAAHALRAVRKHWTREERDRVRTVGGDRGHGRNARHEPREADPPTCRTNCAWRGKRRPSDRRTHERGMITTSTDDLGTIELTSPGEALFEKVIATRSDLRDQLYGGIPPEDFATTKRVLDLIRERAVAVHAG